jgi:phosphate transport system permease protein
MSLFVNKLEFGDSILAGGLLGLLVLPVIIRTEESLKAVDDTFRQASFGLGQ